MKNILSIALITAFYTVIFLFAKCYYNLPLVEINGITGECIKVVEGDATCKDLPKLYRCYKVVPPYKD